MTHNGDPDRIAYLLATAEAHVLADEVEAAFRRNQKEKLETQPPRILARLNATLEAKLVTPDYKVEIAVIAAR